MTLCNYEFTLPPRYSGTTNTTRVKKINRQNHVRLHGKDISYDREIRQPTI